MDSLINYTKMIGYTDNLKALRALLNYPLINWVSQYFSRTRNSDMQLHFVEYCRDIIAYHRTEIDDDEYKRYDAILLSYELSAYDQLNRWQDYISLYKQAVNEGRRESHSWDRYPIICRKQARADAGKSVEHLKRHQQSSLTDNELNNRYAEMARLLKYIIRSHSN